MPLIWVAFIFGKVLENTEPSASNFHWWGWHKSAGLLIITIVFVRLGNRLRSRLVASDDVTGVQHRIAGLAHLFLYVLMLAVPLSGWAASSTTGLPISFFGLFDVPLIWSEDAAAEKLLFRVHGISATILFALSVMHMLVALHHHVRKRNDVLRRMLP